MTGRRGKTANPGRGEGANCSPKRPPAHMGEATRAPKREGGGIFGKGHTTQRKEGQTLFLCKGETNGGRGHEKKEKEENQVPGGQKLHEQRRENKQKGRERSIARIIGGGKSDYRKRGFRLGREATNPYSERAAQARIGTGIELWVV